MIGLLRSILEVFLLRKFGVVGFCNDLIGAVIWQHIHPRFIYSEKRVDKIQQPKGFLGLRIVECRNSSDVRE